MCFFRATNSCVLSCSPIYMTTLSTPVLAIRLVGFNHVDVKPADVNVARPTCAWEHLIKIRRQAHHFQLGTSPDWPVRRTPRKTCIFTSTPSPTPVHCPYSSGSRCTYCNVTHVWTCAFLFDKLYLCAHGCSIWMLKVEIYRICRLVMLTYIGRMYITLCYICVQEERTQRNASIAINCTMATIALWSKLHKND